MEEKELSYLIDKVAVLIVNSKKIVVFTGAGHSTESGISDFRSPGGIWSKYDPDDFTYQKFLYEPSTRKKHWELIRGSLFAGAKPNPGHYAVAELEKMGKLECVITQNVDNLHQAAGNTLERVFELHGNLKWAICLNCRQKYSAEQVNQWLNSGIEVPECPACKGVLKPNAVLFGEALPQDTLNAAVHHSRNCDLMIVLGSTLVVYPAAYIPIYAVESGAKLVIINLSDTPMDSQATVLIRGKIGEVMPRVINKVKDKIKQK